MMALIPDVEDTSKLTTTSNAPRYQPYDVLAQKGLNAATISKYHFASGPGKILYEKPRWQLHRETCAPY